MGKIRHEFLKGLMKIQVLHDLGGDYDFFFFLSQETTEDQSGSLKDRRLQLGRVQDITGCQDSIVLAVKDSLCIAKAG